MNDVLARIGELEQRLSSVSRSRLLFAAVLLLLFSLLPLLLIDADVWLHLLGALATLTAGATGLVKAVELWWKASENGKEAMESDRVQGLEYENAVLQRELRICQDSINLGAGTRWRRDP